METKFNKVRGTHDILPQEAAVYHMIEKTAFDIFQKYQYKEIRLPTFENSGLFARSTGETTDIVEKEMYIFNDKKGRSLALRPEGTPGVVRAFLENNLQDKFPVSKFYYSGPMFRYERPQEGRYREFYQIGCEYFDNAHPVADAEVILMAKEIYSALGIDGLTISINSIGCAKCREKYRAELLAFLNDKREIICEDCKRRIDKNPLRALDCKIDRIKFIDSNIPKIHKYLCAECLKHFTEVENFLKISNITYIFDPCLVRGLDYYTQTVFEASVRSSDILVAGGRYNNLIKQLGGKDTPAVGFALGIERTAQLVSGKSDFIHDSGSRSFFFVVEPKEAVIGYAFKLIQTLKNEKITISAPYPDRSLKSQMRLADSTGAEYVLIAGEQEITGNSIIIRDMLNKKQELVKLPDLVNTLKNLT